MFVPVLMAAAVSPWLLGAGAVAGAAAIGTAGYYGYQWLTEDEGKSCEGEKITDWEEVEIN